MGGHSSLYYVDNLDVWGDWTLFARAEAKFSWVALQIYVTFASITDFLVHNLCTRDSALFFFIIKFLILPIKKIMVFVDWKKKKIYKGYVGTIWKMIS